jgi:Icc-related predicted phosphoesterase
LPAGVVNLRASLQKGYKMQIQIASDLHFEFYDARTDIFDFISKLRYGADPYKSTLTTPDVLILAGDTSTKGTLPITLEILSNYYPEIIYVLGNHEFYQHSFQDVKKLVNDLNIKNVHLLDNNTITIKGQRFVGSTLWFRDDPQNILYQNNMNDFWVIEDFKHNVYQENLKAIGFLNAEVNENDIVITHHVPTNLSVAKKYKGSKLNRFFTCDMSDLIIERQPKVWIHGHTHNSCDHMMGNTRVICNPYGYFEHEENEDFKYDLILDI